MRYPDTPTVDHVDEYHGTEVPDPYRWLEEDGPAVREWVADQNVVTRSWLDLPARERIRRRLTELWDHPRRSAPSRRARRWFQLRNSGLQQQDVLWVMADPADEGGVLVDPNTWSDDGTVALAGAAVSRDGRLLAYARSAAGSDWMTWRVHDIDARRDTGDEAGWSKFSGAAWLPDGSGFLYGRYEPGATREAANRNQQLWLHRLGGDGELVYARPDQPEWGFAPTVTEDGRYVVLHVWHGTHRENRLFYADADLGDFVELLADADAAYEFVGNQGPVFYVLTDLDAPRGRLVAIDARRPDRSEWAELIPQSDDTLEQVRLVGGRFVALYLQHARNRLRRFRLDGAPDGDIDLPGIGAVSTLTGLPDDDRCHFTFVGFTQPPTVYEHTIDPAATRMVHPPGLALDQDRFVTSQEFVTSPDGTRVPVFCVRRADVVPTGDVPTMLWGYGGFGIPVTPRFSVSWLVWVELGGLLAVPNLRGGGEYGRPWHEDGRLDRKQNTFDDAIAVAEHLCQSWTRPKRLAITGGSNGGLLVGACMTQRPDLFGACVPEVGVLDMLRFHQFTIGWAWASDYGTADDPEQFDWLIAYSPLHNIVPGTRYPATLVVTGDHDDRVVPAHSLKFAAALQAAQASGGPPVLLRVETRAGHGAGKPTRVLIDERADVLAFLVGALGVDAMSELPSQA